jgi:hypothetical protein
MTVGGLRTGVPARVLDALGLQPRQITALKDIPL